MTRKILALLLAILMVIPAAIAPLSLAAPLQDTQGNTGGFAYFIDYANAQYDISGDGNADLVLTDNTNNTTFVSDFQALNANTTFPTNIYILVGNTSGAPLIEVSLSFDATRIPLPQNAVVVFDIWTTYTSDANGTYFAAFQSSGAANITTDPATNTTTISVTLADNGVSVPDQGGIVFAIPIDQPAAGETAISVTVVTNQGTTYNAQVNLLFDNVAPAATPKIKFADGMFYDYSTTTYYAVYDSVNTQATVYLELSDFLDANTAADLSMYQLTISGLSAASGATNLTIANVAAADSNTSVTPSGTGYIVSTQQSAAAAYIAITVNLTGLTINDGTTFTVSFTLTDVAGNSTNASFTFTIDTQAPTVQVTSVSRGATPDVYFDSVNNIYWISGSDQSLTITLTITDNYGVLFNKVMISGSATDTQGNTITLAALYPSLTATGNPNEYTITLDLTQLTDTNGNTVSLSNVNPLSLTITAYDEAMNSGSATITFNVDSQAPQLSNIGFSGFQDGSIYLLDLTDTNIQNLMALTFEDGKGFYVDQNNQPLVEVIFNGQQLTQGTDFTATLSGTQLTIAFTATFLANVAPGQGSFTVTVYDIGGNVLQQTFQFYNDTQAPSLTVQGAPAYVSVTSGGSYLLKAAVQASDDYALGTLTVAIQTANINITMIEVYDAATGSLVQTVDLTQNPAATATISLSGSSLDWTLYIYIDGYTSGNVDVQFTVSDRVYDLASQNGITLANHTASQTVTFMEDTIPPVITFQGLTLSGNTWTGYVNTSTLTITVSDAESGVDAANIKIEVRKFDEATGSYILLSAGTDYTVTQDVTTGFAPTVTITLDLSSSGEGQYKIVVSASDAAGNSASATADPVFIDTTPPTIQATATALPGTIKIALASINDNMALDGAMATLTIGGTQFSILIPNASLLFDTNFIHVWAISPAVNGGNVYHNLFDDIEDVYSVIGVYYQDSIQRGAPVFVLVAYNGALYAYPGYITSTTAATLELTVYDAAGNASTFTSNANLQPGFAALLGLEQGWNLVSFPVVLDTAIQSYVINNYLEPAFTTSGAYVKAVFYYEPGTGWQATTITVSFTGAFTASGANIALTHEKGFWVYVEGGDAALLVNGYIPHTPMGDQPAEPLVYVLSQGHNFIGFTSLAPLAIADYFDSIAADPNVYGYIYVFNNDLKKWEVYSIGHLDALMPGEAVWVYAYTSGPTLIVPVWYELQLPPLPP